MSKTECIINMNYIYAYDGKINDDDGNIVKNIKFEKFAELYL